MCGACRICSLIFYVVVLLDLHSKGQCYLMWVELGASHFICKGFCPVGLPAEGQLFISVAKTCLASQFAIAVLETSS